MQEHEVCEQEHNIPRHSRGTEVREFETGQAVKSKSTLAHRRCRGPSTDTTWWQPCRMALVKVTNLR
jgi:hypothetical protein